MDDIIARMERSDVSFVRHWHNKKRRIHKVNTPPNNVQFLLLYGREPSPAACATPPARLPFDHNRLRDPTTVSPVFTHLVAHRTQQHPFANPFVVWHRSAKATYCANTNAALAPHVPAGFYADCVVVWSFVPVLGGINAPT